MVAQIAENQRPFTLPVATTVPWHQISLNRAEENVEIFITGESKTDYEYDLDYIDHPAILSQIEKCSNYDEELELDWPKAHSQVSSGSASVPVPSIVAKCAAPMDAGDPIDMDIVNFLVGIQLEGKTLKDLAPNYALLYNTHLLML